MRKAKEFFGLILRRLKNNYAVARLLIAARTRGRAPVVVYQMGKVGSTSIAHSISSQTGFPVFHFHKLCPKNLHRTRNNYERAFYDTIVRPGREAMFITLVREPLGRNVSEFFQRIERKVAYKEQLTDYSPRKFFGLMAKDRRINSKIGWFDGELKPALGIDVYGKRFPKEKGSLEFRRGPFRLLVLKLEASDRRKERALQEFLGTGKIRLRSKNVGGEKFYSETYRKVGKTLKVPKSYVKKWHGSRYAKHFYTPQELKKAEKKWS